MSRKIYWIAAGALVLCLVLLAQRYLSQRNKSDNLLTPVPRHTPGHWAQDRTHPVETDPERLGEALTLPYLQGYKRAPALQNVTLYQKGSAFEGINFCVSGHEPGAYLMDMQGKVLHRWRFGIADVWPDAAQWINGGFWRRALLYADGSVLAIFEGIGVIKLDAQSKLLWSYRGGCHHQAFVAKDGTISLLTHKALRVPRIDPKKAILTDYITRLSPDGKMITETPVLESLENSEYRSVLAGIPKGVEELFHANSIYVFDGSLSDIWSNYKSGNVMISLLNLDTIAIFDPEQQKVVWAATGQNLGWKRQHDAYPLENGNVILFDNLGRQGKSRVIEFFPPTMQLRWEWPSPESHLDLYSRTCGMTHRLPNGNTLIAESDAGHAVEVTADGRSVWEYYNPYRAGAHNELIATLFQVDRVTPDFVSWLNP